MLNRASVRLAACAGLSTIARNTAMRCSSLSSSPAPRLLGLSSACPATHRVARCCYYHTPVRRPFTLPAMFTLLNKSTAKRTALTLLSSSSLWLHSLWQKSSPTMSLASTATATASSIMASTHGAQVTAKRCFSSTPARHVRVRGRDDYIRPQDTPMHWGGEPSGGNQMDSLTPHVRAHLGRVYSLLTVGCMLAGLGSFLMIGTPLVHVVPFWLPMLGGFVPFLWLAFAPPANPTLKMTLFLSFALLEGMAIAPLVLMTSMKGALVTSIVLTAAIFGGFSAAAYLSPRASLVSWQGPLFGGIIGLVALSLVNAFYPMAIAHSLILYGGLALFSALIAVDTQAMIERARCGVGDHVQDAMQMFLNVINIFVRIAQIMGDR